MIKSLFDLENLNSKKLSKFQEFKKYNNYRKSQKTDSCKTCKNTIYSDCETDEGLYLPEYLKCKIIGKKIGLKSICDLYERNEI